MKLQYTIILFFLWSAHAIAQTPDSLSPADTLPVPAFSDSINVRIAPGGLESTVYYDAKDSLNFDFINKKLYLYGDAHVSFEDIKLNAGYVEVDFGNNIVTALGFPDSSGQMTGFPVFSEKDQEYEAEEMRYNYKSKKGLAKMARTQQTDLYILGGKVKFVTGGKDSTDTKDYIYNKDVVITTCDHPIPHYGIRTKRLKVIPDEIAVAGPSNLEISGVPTPLVLPFGFFPVTSERKAGMIFPTGYEFSPSLGYGVAQLGYFRPINEYINMTLYGQIYTRGTWGLDGQMQYKKNYKYNGDALLSYVKLRNESQTTGQVTVSNTWRLVWNHRQDAKAHPYNTFGGQINFQVNNQQQLLNPSFQAQAQNIINSSMTFRRSFPNRVWTLNAGLTHSQNTQTRAVKVRFPSVDLTMATQQPFARDVGPDRWYENISVSYASRGLVEFEGVDSSFFNKETLQNAVYGIRHNISTDVQFRVLKYFNLTPRIGYTEDWYFRTFDQEPVTEITIDTIFSEDSSSVEFRPDTSFSTNEIERRGFKPLRKYDVSLSMNFNLYGNANFKKFWVRAFRHTMRTQMSLNYSPDYTSERFGYIQSYTNLNGNEVPYSIFRPEAGLGSVSPNETRRLAISTSITNRLEAKVWSKRDSALKKITIMDNLSINANYNFAADSFKLSDISMRGKISLLSNMTTIGLTANLNPYQVGDSRLVDRYVWQDDGFKLPRLERFQANVRTNLSVDRLEKLIKGKDKETKPPKKEIEDDDAAVLSTESGINELTDILRGFRLTHNINYRYSFEPDRDIDTALFTAHNIGLSFSALQLSKNWNVSVANIGYDFLNKRLTYPDFTFRRDLHCWTMSLSVQPTRGTYQFQIAVKPGTLGFIDVPYTRNPQDAGQSLF